MLILPLSSPNATLENAGGKGANLARLVRLSLPVPPGFIVTTEAYRTFVSANELGKVITASIKNITADDVEQLDKASTQIRGAFSAGRFPEEIAQAVSGGYRALRPQTKDDGRSSVVPGPLSAVNGSLPAVSVAVRSSATTEDLPELSFAGQQDTFLNIIGEARLLKAVVDCWSSLWTARAIGYRLRNAVPDKEAALAVIVQEMVTSEVSGVLFTANPLTGLLSESVIEATFGLGEALVSGQVEPDHYVVESFSGAIRGLKLGSKAAATRLRPGGGVQSVREQAAGRQTLSDERVRRLVMTGQQIQLEFGSPQDIEWAFAKDGLYILQSRSITTLFPIPRVSFDPLLVWFSFGAVQGLVGPFTPLGQEAIQRVVLGMGKKLGIQIKYEEQDLFKVARERLWVKISDLIRHPMGNRIIGGALDYIEPSVGQILRRLIDDPRLGAGQGHFKFSTLRRLLGFFLPVAANMLRTMVQPDQARVHFDAGLETYLQGMQIAPGGDRFERLANFAAFMSAQGGLAEALPTLLPRFIPIIGPAMVSLKLIGHLQPGEEAGDHDNSMLALEITRGLPHNVTTEMDLKLWETACMIREDPAAAKLFQMEEAPALAKRYQDRSLPGQAQEAVARFMEKYGMRGFGEIDLGQPRWREDPTPVMATLQSYLQIEPDCAPDHKFDKGVFASKEAIEKLANRARSQRGGWIKEKLVRAAARRVRVLMGARESPKFTAVRAMGFVRNRLLEIGDEFSAAGTILSPDDLFFLHVTELEALSRREERDWKAIIAGRRQAFDRERRRRRVPRLLVSDGRIFQEGLGAATDTGDAITGSPVSPGVIEGVVHVVLDPRCATLVTGEILVCPGTDPAWTPLFMVAAGLVMEVGGMMTHGSVVAREYGIPAVVGVHQATQRLKNGQRIRLDGSNGRIAILEA